MPLPSVIPANWATNSNADHAQRRSVELQITWATINALLGAGHLVSVNDGEDIVLRNSTDANAILAAMYSTDEDYLIARDTDGKKIGMVYFVWGNSGYDCLSDSSIALDDVLDPISALADRLENDPLGPLMEEHQALLTELQCIASTPLNGELHDGLHQDWNDPAAMYARLSEIVRAARAVTAKADA